MSEPTSSPARPGRWWRAALYGVCIGIGPPVGREVADGLGPAWGRWPARLAGYVVGAGVAGAICGGVILMDRRVNPERYQH